MRKPGVFGRVDGQVLDIEHVSFGYSNESAEELMPCCSFNGIVQTLAMSDEDLMKVMQFERFVGSER